MWLILLGVILVGMALLGIEIIRAVEQREDFTEE